MFFIPHSPRNFRLIPDIKKPITSPELLLDEITQLEKYLNKIQDSHQDTLNDLFAHHKAESESTKRNHIIAVEVYQNKIKNMLKGCENLKHDHYRYEKEKHDYFEDVMNQINEQHSQKLLRTSSSIGNYHTKSVEGIARQQKPKIVETKKDKINDKVIRQRLAKSESSAAFGTRKTSRKSQSIDPYESR